MPSRDVTYRFGRLNFLLGHPETTKDKALWKGLKERVSLVVREFIWQFSDLGELKEHFDGTPRIFFHGYLVKYRPVFEEEIFDPDKQAIGDQKIENFVAGKARFFIDIESLIIAYHPIPNIISPAAFDRNFCELLEEAYGKFFVQAEIQTIDEPEQIFSAMKRFKVIHRVSVSLHPANPRVPDVWKRIQERLLDLRASKYKEEVESDSATQGLNVVEDSEFRQKITMAEDGYGEAKVTGTSPDGSRKTVSTRQNPVKQLAPGDEEKSSSVLGRLKSKFNALLQRFHT